MKIKVIIYGFGRMGLTHYAILSQLMENAEFTFIDPDKKIRFFAENNINAKVLTKDEKLIDCYDYALICTPPMFHVSLVNHCLQKKVKNIFVEKPFGGIQDDFSNIFNSSASISIGYVLRFNPIVQYVKQNLKVEDIKKVEGYYFSNTLEKKPKGWRNGSYSGVINEVGAHIIDLSVFLFGLDNPIILNKHVKNVISDVDDILIADLKEKSIDYHFHFDWVNKEYRKPVFRFKITGMDNSLYMFDQQKFEHYKNGELISRVTAVDLVKEIPFYLRGVDFTMQMQDFIGKQEIIATVEDALKTRNLIEKLLY